MTYYFDNMIKIFAINTIIIITITIIGTCSKVAVDGYGSKVYGY